MKTIAVVGAGLVGSLQAIYLAKRGFKVDVFEYRDDLREVELQGGRSINLALSDRGIKALEKVGMAETIQQLSIPMKGRLIHAMNGELSLQPYGKEGQYINSVSRGGLNKELLLKASEYDNVSFHFNHRCLEVDLEENKLTFELGETNNIVHFKADHIFGTDGIFSAVRQKLQMQPLFNFSLQYMDHGYKELCIYPNADSTHQIEKNALHIWPRGQFMLIALPNLDGSFTVTLFFPLRGENSFESLKTAEEVERFFADTFPDALALIPDLAEQYFKNPTGYLAYVKSSPWNYEDKIMLLGDAAHGIVPFYGQGMNSGFEDCRLLDDLYEEEGGDWETTFEKFSKNRQADTDAICDLALSNYIEMRDLVADENFILRKKIERWFSDKHPDKWTPLYSMVTFSPEIPYAVALKEGKKQQKIMDDILQLDNITENWNSAITEQEILSRL